MRKLKLNLPLLITIAMITGSIFGILFPSISIKIKIIGDLFINLIKLILFPLILIMLPYGISRVKNISRLGKVGITGILVIICLNLSTSLFSLGPGFLIKSQKVEYNVENLPRYEVKTLTTKEIFFSIIPPNIVSAISNENILGVMLFSILFGISIILSGEKGNIITDFLGSLMEILFKFIQLIMFTAPIGVFSLMAYTLATYGIKIIITFSSFLLALWIGAIVFLIIICYLGTSIISKVDFRRFIKAITEPFLLGLTTCTSSAVCPITVKNTVEEIGVKEDVAVFMIGSNLVRGGTIIYQVLSVFFLANIYNIELSIKQVILLPILVIFFLVPAGIPAIGTVTIVALLTALGLPLEGIAILMGIDRIRDMISSAMNVALQSLSSILVSHFVKDI
ncbi:hypothetical protein DRQ09_06820 [candidate division KSB1 bacterium]|nr:MAG: hypothetical protein DRQ09_06820 [candidate division KSB1 bacterium]